MSRLAPLVLLVATVLTGGHSYADGPGEHQAGDRASNAGAAAEKGFEPVDPASLETVSGAHLMVAAYSVIVGAILLYCLILLLREGAASRAIKRFEQQVNRQSK
jgi:hypothetical protein